MEAALAVLADEILSEKNRMMSVSTASALSRWQIT